MKEVGAEKVECALSCPIGSSVQAALHSVCIVLRGILHLVSGPDS